MAYNQKGLTLLESVIALGLVTIAVGTMIFSHKSENRQAEQAITHLQMAKTGILRYNIDNPESTNKLADLVQPNEVAPHNWNGPYIEASTLVTADGQFDISRVFPDSHIELTAYTINGITYQAVLLKGEAELQLKNAILAKCGEDCQPLPGRDDIGLLIQQVATVSPHANNLFAMSNVPAVKPPVVSPTTVVPNATPFVIPPYTGTPPSATPALPPAPPIPGAPAPAPTNDPCQVVACTNPNPGPRVPLPIKPPPPVPVPPPAPPAPVPTPPAPTPPAPLSPTNNVGKYTCLQGDEFYCVLVRITVLAPGKIHYQAPSANFIQELNSNGESWWDDGVCGYHRVFTVFDWGVRWDDCNNTKTFDFLWIN